MNFRELNISNSLQPPLQNHSYMQRRRSHFHEIPFSLDSDELNLSKEDSVSSINSREEVIELSNEKSQGRPRGYYVPRLSKVIKVIHKTEVESKEAHKNLDARLPFMQTPWPRIKRGKRINRKRKQVLNPEDIVFSSRDTRRSLPHFKCHSSSIMKNKGGNLVGKLLVDQKMKLKRNHPSIVKTKKAQPQMKIDMSEEVLNKRKESSNSKLFVVQPIHFGVTLDKLRNKNRLGTKTTNLKSINISGIEM
ncbi:unnamed protein product [Moneuplotes crassus]|uniref:Uncharacterized protein n=1 Tax=Euplotes crassus TaxID=5936 RepID=A0AAD1U783_EUPCR|nr:unnamed protein product [Moneuplotes crassus]